MAPWYRVEARTLDTKTGRYDKTTFYDVLAENQVDAMNKTSLPRARINNVKKLERGLINFQTQSN